MDRAQTVTTFNGFIAIASDQPEALARFYGAVLATEAKQGLSTTHWQVDSPHIGRIEFYVPSRSRPQKRQAGRLSIGLMQHASGAKAITVLEIWCQRVVDLGGTLIEAPRCEDFGAEACLLDPEGNRLLLLVS